MRTEHETRPDDLRRDDIWRWIWDDADDLEAVEAVVHAHGDDPAGEEPRPPVLVAVPDTMPDEEHDARARRDAGPDELPPSPRAAPDDLATLRPVTIVPPLRALRGDRRRARRRLLIVAGAAAMVGVVAVGALRLMSREEPRSVPPGPASTSATSGDQRVVAFAVWDEGKGPGYLAVLAAGGGHEPVAVAFPDATAVTIPGQGFATVADAMRSGDVTVIQATVENVLGVRVDEALGIPLEQLAPLVDALGLLDLSGELASGEDVVRYLSPRRVPGPERLARWQEVLASLLTAAKGRADQLDGIPPRLEDVFGTGAEVVPLPTEEIGAGLVTPDREAIGDLVSERFVTTTDGPTTSAVRLVVLNANGAPGVGEEVARLLVPEGFRLVTNVNAPTFDLQTTQILASSRDYLDEARLARRLLGVGEVFLDAAPSGVADVTVQIGDDFGRP